MPSASVFSTILKKSNDSVTICEDDFRFILTECQTATDKTDLFRGIGANDHSAGLTEAIHFSAGFMNFRTVHMTADHQIGMHFLAEK